MTEPGIYHGMSHDEYRALPYLCQSILKLVDEDEPYGMTLRHARMVYEDQGKPPAERRMLDRKTDALRLGAGEHAWIVEGEAAFRESHVIAPDRCEATKGDGERCKSTPKYTMGGHWLCGTHSDKDTREEPRGYIHAADVARIRRMAERVRDHQACQFLKRPGWSEATIIYDVEVRVAEQQCTACKGIACLDRTDDQRFRCRICKQATVGPGLVRETRTLRHKARLDRLSAPIRDFPHLVLDLKRMQVGAGSLSEREKCIRNYGWDVQAAEYTEAVRHHFEVDRCHYGWLFVEENEPHDCRWMSARPRTLAIGAHKLSRYRRLWALGEITGDWTGYDSRAYSEGLPGHYIDRYEKTYCDSEGNLEGAA